MIKCVSHSFRNNSHCQCRWPHCILCWTAVFWHMCFARTTYSHSLETNNPAITISIDTCHEYSSKENWKMDTVVYEMTHCIDIFWSIFLVAWQRGLPRKFACFVLFCLIKKRSFNLLCVLDIFSECWQSTLFQIFFFFFVDIFWVNFVEGKIPKFKISYLSFYCKFEVSLTSG